MESNELPSTGCAGTSVTNSALAMPTRSRQEFPRTEDSSLHLSVLPCLSLDDDDIVEEAADEYQEVTAAAEVLSSFLAEVDPEGVDAGAAGTREDLPAPPVPSCWKTEEAWIDPAPMMMVHSEAVDTSSSDAGALELEAALSLITRKPLQTPSKPTTTPRGKPMSMFVCKRPHQEEDQGDLGCDASPLDILQATAAKKSKVVSQQRQHKVNMFPTRMPPDLLCRICGYLSATELLGLRLVHKASFRQLATTNAAGWDNLCRQLWKTKAHVSPHAVALSKRHRFKQWVQLRSAAGTAAGARSSFDFLRDLPRQRRSELLQHPLHRSLGATGRHHESDPQLLASRPAPASSSATRPCASAPWLRPPSSGFQSPAAAVRFNFRAPTTSISTMASFPLDAGTPHPSLPSVNNPITNCMQAYRHSLYDAKTRHSLTHEELCFRLSHSSARTPDSVRSSQPVFNGSGTIWQFRFKAAAGFDWTSMDPWYAGFPSRKVVFLNNGTVKLYVEPDTNDPLLLHGDNQDPRQRRNTRAGRTTILLENGARLVDPPLTTGNMTWRFLTRPMDLPTRPIGSYVRCSVGGRDVPTYSVRRSPTRNWGFIMESCWGVYTSFELPPLERIVVPRRPPSLAFAPGTLEETTDTVLPQRRRSSRRLLRRTEQGTSLWVDAEDDEDDEEDELEEEANLAAAPFDEWIQDMVDDEKVDNDDEEESPSQPLSLLEQREQYEETLARRRDQVLLADEALQITNDIQWREAFLYNVGARVLPEGEEATDEFDRAWGEL